MSPENRFIFIYRASGFFLSILEIWWFQNFSIGMYAFMGIYSTFGWIWCMLSICYPPTPASPLAHSPKSAKSALKKSSSISHWASIIGQTLLELLLSTINAAHFGAAVLSKERIAVSIATSIFACVLYACSLAQHCFPLQRRVSLGIATRTRNPNCLAFSLFYISLAIATANYYSYAIAGLLILGWIVPLAIQQDNEGKSEMRDEQLWKQYEEQSSLLIPQISSSIWLNGFMYAILVGFCYFDYSHGGIINYLDYSTKQN